MTAGAAQAITVRILDKEYRVMCEPGERDALLAAAQYLNDKLLGIRASGRVVGTDRLAVMAALNISHELLELRNSEMGWSESVNTRIRSMQHKIEAVLGKTEVVSI